MLKQQYNSKLLFSIKKEVNHTTYDIYESEEYYTKWNNSVSERKTEWTQFYVESKKAKLIEVGIKMMATRSGKRKGCWKMSFKGYKHSVTKSEITGRDVIYSTGQKLVMLYFVLEIFWE